MAEIAGLPFVKLKFDKDGDRVEPATPIRPTGIRNLIVIAHGWKNDEADADRLYRTLIENMRNAPGGDSLATGKFGVTGVYWPAFVFKPDLTLVDSDVPAGGQGGAAAAGDGDLSSAALTQLGKDVAAFLQIEDIDGFLGLVVDARKGGQAADALVERLEEAAPLADADAEIVFEHPGRVLSGGALFELMKQPPAVEAVAAGDQGGALGGAVHGGSAQPHFLAGPRAFVAGILNQFTYVEMKKRAGVIGATLAPILDADNLDGVTLHLIGHSFGARLVTATASHLATIRPRTLVLLQAAYSHNGLGLGKGDIPPGAFRNVVVDKRVAGAIAITHTRNDRAVSFAYAAASRATGVNAAAIIGGPSSPFGGMGANGAQLMGPGEAFAADPSGLKAGRVNNVLADAFITGHNDVTNPKVARMALAALLL